mgnify:CR=1 FL=1|jgi:SAM-dependent methyltransferase
MNHIEVESTYLTYLKLFEGLNVPVGCNKTACDLSFNNGITAKYLVDKKNFQKVYIFDNKNIEYNNSIFIINSDKILLELITHIKFDFVISLGGIANLNPIYETIQNIYKLLNIGGRLLVAVYPDIFNDSGKDILSLLSNLLEIPVKEKLLRLHKLLYNGISNIFNSVREFEILQDASINEIKSLYMLEGYSNYVCACKGDIVKFFAPLDKVGKKFYFGWNIIEAIKL